MIRNLDELQQRIAAASGLQQAASGQSLRNYLAALAAEGNVVTVAARVSLEFELAACLAQIDGGPAAWFTNVGHKLSVVGNLTPSLARMAESLNINVDSLQSHIVAAIEHPLEHRLLSSSPCQEIVVADPSLVDELPIPRFFAAEDGPYITAGAVIAQDPTTGQANLSIARLRPLGGNRAFVGIAPNHHLSRLAQAAHTRGEKLDIAVCLGNHPAVLMAACLYLGLGDDELRVAGALLRAPLEVVRCLGSDLLIPAHCECVLEGRLDAAELAPEGWVSEFHGMYESYGPGIVATFSRLTRRRDAFFQVILPGHHREHCLLGGVAIAAGLARALQPSLSNVDQVAVGMGGAGRLHAVVSLHKPQEGDARRAMHAVWSAVTLIKRVVVVDEDIDPWNSELVEWAIATRMRPERDLLVVPGARTDRSEPLAAGGVVGKLGIDATCRGHDRKDWRRAEPPPAAVEKARQLLAGLYK